MRMPKLAAASLAAGVRALTAGTATAVAVPASAATGDATVTIEVTLAGQTAAVLGPLNVPVTAGMGTVVYAIGSASGSTLTAVTQQYALGGGAVRGAGGQRRPRR